MPYKGGVQLLPESQRRPTLRSYTSGNTYFYTAVVLAVLILVTGATLGGYKKRLREQIDEVRAQLDASEKGRVVAQEKELIAASKQSKIMRQLLDGKLYWSQALGRIEQMMQLSVKLVSIEGAADKGTVAFRASADSYASVARQLAAFAAATGIKDIAVDTIEATAQGTVEFSGELQIDTKSLLMKSAQSPTPTPNQ